MAGGPKLGTNGSHDSVVAGAGGLCGDGGGDVVDAAPGADGFTKEQYYCLSMTLMLEKMIYIYILLLSHYGRLTRKYLYKPTRD